MELKIDNAGIAREIIKKTGENLIPVSEQINTVVLQGGYKANESFVNLPSDEEILKEVKKVASEKTDQNLKYIIVVGIGGSNLGAKAVYDAMHGHLDLLNPKRFPKIIFIDTNNSETLSNLKNLLNTEIKDPSEIIINVVSKSGNTVETIANTEFIAGALSEKFGDISDRIIVTTDEDSVLCKKSEEKGITLLSIPENVSGRYSVFSAVGLLPIILAGIDAEEFLRGAKNMKTLCISENISENPAMLSATILFLNYEKGKTINDNFLFHGELETLGKWYRQLMGESIGKNGKGLTPTVSIGSTDLHSVGQLYIGGPKDKLISFIKSKKSNGVSISTGLLPELAEGINGKSSEGISDAIFEGVKMTYIKKEVPFMEIILDDISPKSIGEFMQFKMMEMIYLGELLEVNVFNQPDVEAYKEETRRILLEK